MRIQGSILAALARMGETGSGVSLRLTARWSGRTLTVQSGGSATRGHTVVQYTAPRDDVAPPSGERFVPLPWLKTMGSAARGPVDLQAMPDQRVEARWETPARGRGKRARTAHCRRYSVDAWKPPQVWPLEEGFEGPVLPPGFFQRGGHGFDAPTLRDWPQARAYAFDGADWAPGGCVACVLPFSGLDPIRGARWGVHFDAVASASDGHRLSQHVPCAPAAGLDAMIPLPAVQAILSMCKAAPPARMRAARTPPNKQDEHGALWVMGACDDGSSWVVFATCGEPPPPYADVASSAQNLPHAVSVDVQDLRDFARLNRDTGRLAVLEDGSLVAWCNNDRDDVLVSTNAPSWPLAPPRVVFDPKFLDPMVDRMLERGRITIRCGDPLDPLVILGEILMPMRVLDGSHDVGFRLPEDVLAPLRASFALDAPTVAPGVHDAQASQIRPKEDADAAVAA